MITIPWLLKVEADLDQTWLTLLTGSQATLREQSIVLEQVCIALRPSKRRIHGSSLHHAANIALDEPVRHMHTSLLLQQGLVLYAIASDTIRNGPILNGHCLTLDLNAGRCRPWNS